MCSKRVASILWSNAHALLIARIDAKKKRWYNTVRWLGQWGDCSIAKITGWLYNNIWKVHSSFNLIILSLLAPDSYLFGSELGAGADPGFQEGGRKAKLTGQHSVGYAACCITCWTFWVYWLHHMLVCTTVKLHLKFRPTMACDSEYQKH